MGRIYFGDIFTNNFGDFWNNSTKFGEILDISKYIFLAYITWQLLERVAKSVS